MISKQDKSRKTIFQAYVLFEYTHNNVMKTSDLLVMATTGLMHITQEN